MGRPNTARAAYHLFGAIGEAPTYPMDGPHGLAPSRLGHRLGPQHGAGPGGEYGLAGKSALGIPSPPGWTVMV